jgi:Flp pilus assembly protein TadB
LIVCAITLGSASSATYALGWTHGLLWIGMSLVCIAAARVHVIPFWLAVTVAVLGGLGPFAGTIGFAVERRRRREQEALVTR